MNSTITDIIAAKRRSLEDKKRTVSLAEIKEKARQILTPRDFRSAVSRRDRINIIAEIKKASPSAGDIAAEASPEEIAREYSEGGAAAISVITEESYFKGDLSFLGRVRKATTLPLLRKDFIFDPYQIYESAVAGADAILLIASLLSKDELNALMDVAGVLGLDCLVEVHNEEEMIKVSKTRADIVGINNRDLETFAVDPDTAIRLLPHVPVRKTLVVESGIRTAADVRRYAEKDVRSFLIGETLMRNPDRIKLLQDMKGALHG
jgi:indole-3-glycerol phosphate synthase